MISLSLLNSSLPCSDVKVVLGDFSTTSVCFYFEYEVIPFKFNKNKFYWRLVGEKNNLLYSLGIINNIVVESELMIFDLKKPIFINSVYTKNNNIIENFLPLFEIIPIKSNIKTNAIDCIIDNYIDYQILIFNDCIRIYWSDISIYKMYLVSEKLGFEISENGVLIGIVFYYEDMNKIKYILNHTLSNQKSGH